MEWLDFLAWPVLAMSLAGSAYLVCASVAVWSATRRPLPHLRTPQPASLLKPLHGADSQLYENLLSFCHQDHPVFQIVFGVVDADDPAIPVVRRVMAEFPALDLTLVVGGSARAPNRKVQNLQNMLPEAKHPILVISDADMRVTPIYLATVTAPLSDDHVGLVTCLYRGVSAGGFWSKLACLYVNHGFFSQAAVGAALDMGTFGATLALTRATLETSGGLAALADQLADDNALGEAVRHLGKRVVVSSLIVDTMIWEPSLMALFKHELRWARTLRLVAPEGYIASVVTHPVVLGLLAWILTLVAGEPFWAFWTLVMAFLARWATFRLDDRLLGLNPTPLYLIPPRDLLSFVVFIASFFTRHVAWRDRRLRIGRDGRLTLDGDRPA